MGFLSKIFHESYGDVIINQNLKTIFFKKWLVLLD